MTARTPAPRAGPLQEAEPKLPNLLKLLVWAQRQLDEKVRCRRCAFRRCCRCWRPRCWRRCPCRRCCCRCCPFHHNTLAAAVPPPPPPPPPPLPRVTGHLPSHPRPSQRTAGGPAGRQLMPAGTLPAHNQQNSWHARLQAAGAWRFCITDPPCTRLLCTLQFTVFSCFSLLAHLCLV